jgi:hypothetical protein
MYALKINLMSLKLNLAGAFNLLGGRVYFIFLSPRSFEADYAIFGSWAASFLDRLLYL